MTTADPDPKLHDCPVLAAIHAISGKWKTRLLWLLRRGPAHFGEIRRHLPDASAKVLTDQLRQLIEDGIILRTDEMRHGVRHSVYAYSDYGATLVPILDLLGNWGLAHEARVTAVRPA